jgi:hypothetical protein
LRNQGQFADFGPDYGVLREGHGKTESLVPGAELVHIVGAEELTGLAGQDIENAVIQAGEVDGHSLGRSGGTAGLFHGVAVARLGQCLRSAPAFEDRDLAEDRMLQSQRRLLCPFPRCEIGRSFFQADSIFHRRCQ